MAKKSDKVTRNARIRAEKWFAYWHQNIENYHLMTSFILGEQWTEDEQDMLKTYKKVPLQINKLGVLSNTLCGEQQQNTPQLQVVPMENCDEETANLRELIVKDIMFSGDAKYSYQTAAHQAINGGFSAIAVLTNYKSYGSFDQDIYYKAFKDPTKVYFDVSAEDPTKTDGMYCGWIMNMSRAKFADIYGKNIEEKILPDNNEIFANSEEVGMATGTNSNENMTWADENTVKLQYDFTRKSYPETFYKLSNGRVLKQDEMDELIQASEDKRTDQLIAQRMKNIMQMQQQSQQQQNPAAMQDPNMAQGQYDPLLGQQAPQSGPQLESPASQQPQAQSEYDMGDQSDADDLEGESLVLYDGDEIVRIEDKKEEKCYRVKHRVICGQYVLEETDIECDILPIVFLDQRSYYNKQGKQICRSFFGDAKDAQKYINYLATQSAYVLKVSRYDQWIGSKKNVASQDTQQRWRDPITQQGMITFDESPSGVVPQRIDPPELSQSLLTQYQRAIEDLYTSTGLYPMRLGQGEGDTSGAAVDAHTRQGNYATFVVFNSINRAIAKCGEIVNKLIPSVYDSTRVISLMTPDEGMKNFTINRQADEYGELIENDIRKGTYEVRLLPGPSYEGQKEQALASLNSAITAYPPAFPMIADLYAENLPLANSIELKNRFKTLVPPQVLEAGKTGQVPPQQPGQEDPQLARQQQQMAMQQQFQQSQLKLKQQEIQIKAQELQLKAQKQTADTQLQMAQLQAEQDKIEAELKKSQMQYDTEAVRATNDMATVHANNMAKILTHKL